MKQLTFSIGLGFDRDGKQLTGLTLLNSKAQNYLSQTFGGFTWLEGVGGWRDASKLYYDEPTAYAVVFTDTDLPTAQRAARVLAKLYNQQSVILTQSPIAYLETVSQDTADDLDFKVAEEIGALELAESKYESSVNFESFELPENPRIN